MQRYDFEWARGIWLNYARCYPRATKFFFKLYGGNSSSVIKLIRFDHKRWETYKKIINFIRKTQRLPGPMWENKVWKEQITLEYYYTDV